MKKISQIIFLCLLVNALFAQQYRDYLGAGHMQGITVTTSHNEDSGIDGERSIDGFPVDDTEALKDASRFLAHATMGYNYDMIQMVAAMGYEAWIDDQFSMPDYNLVEYMIKRADEAALPPEDASMDLFRVLWWELMLKSPDALRQRLTYMLSQIFVVSAFGSDLFEDFGVLSAGHYNVLNANAFENYRDLLSSVSRNFSMGMYLSHFNNPKSDPSKNIHPDENYAREVMQLFSIGLHELNNDGTPQLDNSGQVIPTYDNEVIREFAKIFTGFGAGHPEGQWGEFDDGEAFEMAVYPMRMYDEWHEPGEKRLLNGQVVPAGQSGMEDFEDAMDNLHNHPNVGPFIGKALIQLMVSANPSPAYVGRVADAFNNNGDGVRGDLRAVIKAILLDEEARDCNAINNPTGGKLREPLHRYTGFLRAFDPEPEDGIFLDRFDLWYDQVGQVPMYASSVFNFYQPAFQPNGLIADADLVAPVFQIHNSSTSIGFINQVEEWTFAFEPMEGTGVELDFEEEFELLDDPEELVDRLDLLLACGQLSDRTKGIIVNAMQSDDLDPIDQLNFALYLIMISPDYAILK